MTKRNYRAWTKEDLRKVLKMWGTVSVSEIADELGTTRPTIYAIAKRFRESGVELSRKTRKGYIDSLIKEIIAEGK